MIVDVDLSIFYVLVCFLVIFWMAAKTLFKPLDRILNERREMIESAEAAVENLGARTNTALEEYNQRISEARSESFALRQELKQAAGVSEREVIDKARANAAEMVTEAQAELQQAAEKSRQELAGQSDEIAERIVTAVLGRQA